MKVLKPALETVGKFIIQFGAKVQQIISAFSITLDRVQKIFDQIMHSVGHEYGYRVLEQQTFPIFDFNHDGLVEASDLHNVGAVYDVPVLKGNKSNDLVKKYDEDHTGGLNRQEFAHFVKDPSVPHIMSVVLRSFAKKLSEVAGQVKGAKFRGEIAGNVVSYFDLMVSKNHTKVGWVSDALG